MVANAEPLCQKRVVNKGTYVFQKTDFTYALICGCWLSSMSDMRRVGRLVGDKIGCNGVNTGRLLLWVPEITVVGEFPDKRKGGGGELSFDDSMSSDPKVL